MNHKYLTKINKICEEGSSAKRKKIPTGYNAYVATIGEEFQECLFEGNDPCE